MFTATNTQAATYHYGVCLYSISFLLILNASVSFVLTDIFHLDNGIGDAVGTLGFADELIVLAACPFWGLLSDRIGFSTVSALGYAIIGISLFIFVHAQSVYPGLLLARMLFALGAAAAATMVTAILPSMTARSLDSRENIVSGQTPPNTGRLVQPEHDPNSQGRSKPARAEDDPTRLAGIVGAFTGAGALIALGVFLPLPARFSKLQMSKEQALQSTFYVVGAIAFVVSITCLFGLRRLRGEELKSWKQLWSVAKRHSEDAAHSDPIIAYRKLFLEATWLGMADTLIGLGYLGGFVARASSVGITLFIPLLVNNYYVQSGLCDIQDPTEVKTECRGAYVLAAKLTGASQLVALLSAPLFGYIDSMLPRFHGALIGAALAGIVGYTGLALIKSPDPASPGGTALVYVVMALLGISQIGAIVCSLSLLGRAIAAPGYPETSGSCRGSMEDSATGQYVAPEDAQPGDETANLLDDGKQATSDRHRLQGSIAGVYSLCGGIGILLLTKLGGYLFDASPAAPFIMMASFNVLLLCGTVLAAVMRHTALRG